MNQVIVVPYDMEVIAQMKKAVKHKDMYVRKGNLKSLETLKKEFGEDSIIHFRLSDVTHSVYGDYVITPVPNAFNIGISYWISKKGYTSSYYCFSTNSYDETLITEEEFKSYIDYFETRLKA